MQASKHSITKVFISYIAEEVNLANILKTHIESDFVGLVEVFAFSDRGNNPAGERWLDNLGNKLGEAEVQLILCSRESINRPWINFEAGAGWLKSIPVIPICHTGMKISDLPIPLKMLVALEANQSEHLRTLYSRIAESAEMNAPQKDFTAMLEEIHNFEQDYRAALAGKEQFDNRVEEIEQGLNALTLGIAELELREKITVIRYRAAKLWDNADEFGRDEMILLIGDSTAGLPLFQHAPKEIRSRYIEAVVEVFISLSSDNVEEGANYQKQLLEDLMRDVSNLSAKKMIRPEITEELESLIQRCTEKLRAAGLG